MLNRLDYLKLFCSAAKHKTFKDAAIEMNVSPQVVTRCIQELESQLGEILFIRSTRNIQISTFGSQFYEKALETLRMLDDMFSPPTEENPSVRITAPLVICRTFILPIIGKITAEYPDISFDLRPSDTFTNVVEEKIDIGIRVGAYLTNTRFIARTFGKVKHVVVATPTLIERCGIPSTPTDLHHLPTTALLDKNKKQVWPWFFSDHQNLIPARPVFTTDDSETEFDAVCAGIGFGQIAVYTAAPAIKKGLLIPVLQAFEDSGELDLFLYRPQSGPVPARVRLVYDMLVKYFSDPEYFPTTY
ncbi:LysR family transcriptional regulator [uncultured Tolumonas sp.]|uniref:LysR family transcriptional regulator n=1 Tax=uncultured Tolumonas sp. TaxID=263765 RepID=UPI002A0A515E|nr:LysR family transcriptional regulator [uncultured Tolumonas sp.]